MVDLALLSEEHAEIEALMARLLTEIEAPAPSQDLSALRWRLNYALVVHLAKEDKLLYPRLRRHDATRGLAARITAEAGGLADAYLDYSRTWPIERVEADWRGFGAATRKIVETARHRTLREERDLFPCAVMADLPTV